MKYILTNRSTSLKKPTRCYRKHVRTFDRLLRHLRHSMQYKTTLKRFRWHGEAKCLSLVIWLAWCRAAIISKRLTSVWPCGNVHPGMHVCTDFMALTRDMVLCASSQDSVFSVSERRVHVVFWTAGCKGGGKPCQMHVKPPRREKVSR